MTPGLGKDSVSFGVIFDHTFLNLEIIRSEIRPHLNWTVSLVIAYGNLIFLMGSCGYVWVNILTLSPSRGHHD